MVSPLTDAPPPAGGASPADSNLPPARILVVENEELVGLTLRRQLTSAGYEVCAIVDNGAEALSAAGELRPDLVLMDINLGAGMDGVETAARIRDTTPAPVVYVTGYADEDTLRRAKITGPCGYLLKPFRQQELYVAVEMALYKDRMERQLALRSAELAEINQELEAFAYSVSHDLRTPLAAIEMFTRGVLDGNASQLHADDEQRLHRVLGSVRRADALIRDLLDYSRLSRSELELQPVPLEMPVAIALEQLAAAVEAQNAAIDIHRPMPTVLAHLATLTQVVTNLLSNAIKFAGADTPPVVTVDAETKEDRVVLSVTDNGVGIPPDQRDTIFGVFQRAHRDQAFPGTGIGLAIVRKAIQRMNGRVGVESEVGRGSRFWIELPAAAENAVQHLPGTG